MENQKKYILRGISGVTILRIMQTLLTLVISIVLARLMSPNEFGLYYFAIETMMLISLPISVGLSLLLSREVAIYFNSKKFQHIKGVINWSFSFTTVVSVLLSIMTVVGLYFLLKNDYEKNVFYIAVPIIIFQGIISVSSGILRGFKAIIISQIAESLIRPGIMLIGIGFTFFLLNTDITSLSGTIINVISFGICGIVSIFCVLQLVPFSYFKVYSITKSYSWFRESWPFIILGAVDIINTKLCLILLGVFKSNIEVGFFKIVVTAANFVTFILVAVNLTVSPLIAELFYANKLNELQRILNKSAAIIFISSFSVVIIFILFGEFFITLLYGSEYLPVYFPLVVLSIGQLLYASAGVIGSVLNMTGNQKETLKGQMAAIITGLVLSLLFIPSFGVMGASFAVAISLLIRNIVLLNKLKVNGIGLTTGIIGCFFRRAE